MIQKILAYRLKKQKLSVKNGRKSIKKTFGKIGLFLIFGMLLINSNFRIINNTDTINGENSIFVDVKFDYLKANAQSSGEASELSFMQKIDAALVLSGIMMDKVPTPVDTANFVLKSVFAKLFLLALNTLLLGVFELINGHIMPTVIKLLDYSLVMENFRSLLRSPEVYSTWSVVRDFLNLFFMLVLLFSAFATIFQVEKYHLKKMIILLVVMALLVNFSYPISLFIVDFSNSVMVLLSNVAFSGAESPTAKLADITSLGGVFKGAFTSLGGQSEITAKLLLAIIFSFIFMITTLALAVNLIIRMFAIILLVIFSPAGFALSFFPATKGVADAWWNNLFKYSIIGPVLVFFMMLSVKFFDLAEPISSTSKEINEFSIEFSKYILSIIFLWIGLIASQKFGGAASGMAMNVAKRAGKMVQGATKFGAHWVDRQAANKFGYSVMGLRQGWKDRTARLDSEAMARTSGKMEDTLENIISRTTSLNPYFLVKRIIKGAKEGGEGERLKGMAKEVLLDPSDRDRTDRDYIAKSRLSSQKAKEIEEISTNTDYLLMRARNATTAEEFHGVVKVLTKQNDLINEYMREENGGRYNSEELPEFLMDKYKKFGLTDSQIARNFAEVGEIGIGSGNTGPYAMSKLDPEKGDWAVVTDPGDRAKAAASKIMNFESQQRQKIMHPDNMFVFDENGEIERFTKTGVEFLNNFKGDDIDQSHRTRGDFKKHMHNAVKAMREGNAEIENQFRGDINRIGKEYILTVNNIHTGMDKANAWRKAKEELDGGGNRHDDGDAEHF